MKKRFILLVLLLLNVFFYSCSSNKSATKTNSEGGEMHMHSQANNPKDGKKKKDTVSLKQKHYDSQKEYVQKEMKKNEKISMENTPVRKKKSKSLCSKNKNGDACGRKVKDAAVSDGVRDVR